MKKYFENIAIKAGLAIFAMLFGAGNLIFPPKVGITSGNQTMLGMIAFILSGVCIPLLGLIGMAFFDGNYRTFFDRIGKIPGRMIILLCMLTIGPLLIMPRITTLTYEMLRPFIENYISLFSFSLIFAVVTFLFAYRKNSLVDIIGKFLSPLKLGSLLLICAIAFITRKVPAIVDTSSLKIFTDNLLLGYNTFDLPGSIFFAYIIILVLKNTVAPTISTDKHKMAKIMLHASFIGGGLLALVYLGIGFMGAWHGQGLEHLDAGKMLITTLIRILGSHAILISLTVLLACLTTNIALSSVVTEYLRTEILNTKLSYVQCLGIVLFISTLMSQLELGPLLYYSEPFINVIYPILIVLSLCNIAYYLWNFKFVKIPVLIAFILSAIQFGPAFIDRIQTGAPKAMSKELIESKVQQ